LERTIGSISHLKLDKSYGKNRGKCPMKFMILRILGIELKHNLTKLELKSKIVHVIVKGEYNKTRAAKRRRTQARAMETKPIERRANTLKTIRRGVSSIRNPSPYRSLKFS
jgi:hypothetical protein